MDRGGRTSQPVGHSLAAQLRDKAERVRWGPKTRDEEFALFSKSGFVDGLVDELASNGSLFDLTEIDANL
jgi:hypothetical protein